MIIQISIFVIFILYALTIYLLICRGILIADLFTSRKVFKKLGFELSDDVIHNISSCKLWAAEQFLLMLREKLEASLVPANWRSPPSSGTRERFEHGYFFHFSHHQMNY